MCLHTQYDFSQNTKEYKVQNSNANNKRGLETCTRQSRGGGGVKISTFSVYMWRL